MLDIFSGLRLVVKRRSISIDNAIFRCHWFFTSTLLVSFSLIITARQYVGQPIECHSVNKIPDTLLNSYCWVQSTFTVPQACNQQVGFEVPYPCIDNTRGREIKIFAYYQWVGMVLFVQGLLFHLPYYLWKVWENGLIKAITGGLRVAVLSDQERAKKKEIVVDYIHDHLGCHKRYALKYFLCEFICLVNLIAQLWATNKFFDGQFLRYGLDVLQYPSSSLSSQFGLSSATSSSSSSNQHQQQQQLNNSTTLPSQKSLTAMKIPSRSQLANQQQVVDPMTYIFPRITKCTYYDFGSSGDVQKHDALCLLPLNIINEKIYIALWFWFLILALLTLLVIIYRLLAIVSESVRCKGLVSRCKLSNENDIRVICRHCDVGDWFLFYMVAENLDPLIMREIVASIAEKIRAHFALKKELGVDFDGRRDSLDQYSPYKHKSAVSGAERYRIYSSVSSSFREANNSFDQASSQQQLQQQQQLQLQQLQQLQQRLQQQQQQQQLLQQQSYASPTTSRRNSLAEEMPLVKKIKKRLYTKRLWSMDLGSGELRQQLFGQQPPLNPDRRFSSNQVLTDSSVVISAPPASEMPLNSAPPLNNHERLQSITQRRRSSLTRTISNDCSTSSNGSSNSNSNSNNSTNTTDSFIMEMQTISGSSSQLDEQPLLARRLISSCQQQNLQI